MTDRIEPSRRWRAVTGGAFAIAAVAFLVLALARNWRTARDALETASPAWLAVAFVVAGSGMIALALPWRRVTGLLGGTMTHAQTLRWYLLGETGKYVPGAIWAVVGRAELARRAGLPAEAAYGGVGLSLGFAYLAAAMTATALLPFAQIEDGAWWPVLVPIVVIPVGLALLHPSILGWLISTAERFRGRPLRLVVPAWTASVRTVARYVPAWILIGTATWCATEALTDIDPAPVLFATVLSWLVGFLVVPAPGGVGVREAVFATVAPLPFGLALTAALVARFLFVCFDALAAGWAWRAQRRSRHTGDSASG